MVDTGVHTMTLSGMIGKQKTRTVVNLSAEDRKALDALSKKTGAPIGELIRRAVAAFLAKKENR